MAYLVSTLLSFATLGDMLVAFSGYARSGKDEAAKALVELGFRRVAFADKLRDFLLALDPIVAPYEVRVSEVIRMHGWDGYKGTSYGPEVRQLLQRLGTECGRDLLYENVWVDAALKDVTPESNFVVTDCRFPNEAAAVKSRGGKIYRIVRPGVGPANDHPSETSLDDYTFDGILINDGTLDEFHQKVRNRVCA